MNLLLVSSAPYIVEVESLMNCLENAGLGKLECWYCSCSKCGMRLLNL